MRLSAGTLLLGSLLLAFPELLGAQTRAVQLPVPIAAPSSAQGDTLPRPDLRPYFAPPPGVLPAVAAGLVIGLVAPQVHPGCGPSSSAQSAAVGALWGGFQRKFGIWKNSRTPTRTHGDPTSLGEQSRTALEEYCGDKVTLSAFR